MLFGSFSKIHSINHSLKGPQELKESGLKILLSLLYFVIE